MSAEQRVFQAEIKQLLHILVHSLYKDRDIFLRELISNASDALNKIQYIMLTHKDVLDAGASLDIHLYANPEQKTIRIVDTGIGMTHDELINNLGVIAQSSIKAFVEQVQDSNVPIKSELIGQFGVGFYSVFMAADRVEVTSKSYQPDEPAYRWVSNGEDTYEISPAEKTTRGTEILIHLREDATEFANAYRLRQAIKQHSDYVAFPILVHDESAAEPEAAPEPVNQQKAMWRRSPSEVGEEDYETFYRSLTMDMHPPALKIHAQGDAPIQYYALLFIPKTAEKPMFSLRKEPGLKLYARKILIQEYTTDLLPEYLQFVQGVVDSEDIPLNVSRETVQANTMMTKLKQVVTRKVLSELKRVAQNEPELYASLWAEFGNFLKQGAIVDYEDRERLLPLLRFHSTDHDLTTLEDYVERLEKVTGQNAIYYLIADNPAAASRSPHLAPFRERGIEVLYMVDSVDGFLLRALNEFKGYKFVGVDADEVELAGVGTPSETENEPVDESSLENLLQRIREVLGDSVETVRISKVLTASAGPVRLVAPEGALDRHTQRVYQMLDKKFEVPARILEINPHSSIIQNLVGRLGGDAALVDNTIQVLYGNALLADGIHPNPAELTQQIQALLEATTRL